MAWAQTWISNVAAVPDVTTATITWNSAVPANGAVSYGATTNYGNGTGADYVLATAHSRTLTGLTASTPYHFQVVSSDSSGVKVSSLDYTFTTKASVLVSISPSTATISSGGSQQFTATVTNGVNTAVTWTTSAGIITAAGLYTAPTVTVDSVVTVTATSVADTTKSASATVTVKAPTQLPVVVNFDSPACPNGYGGGGGAPLTGTYQGINWGSSPWDCEKAAIDTTYSASWMQPVTKATFSFVAPSILTQLQAGSSSGNGTLTVSTDAGETMSWAVTGGVAIAVRTTGFVKPATVITVAFTGGWTLELDNITYTAGASVPPAPVVAVAVSPKTATVSSGGAQQFSASVTGTTNTAVTWSTTSGAVSAAGLFTAPTTYTDLAVTVTAKSVADATKSDSAVVTVKAAGTLQHTVALSWNASTSPVVSYKVYRGTASGGPYSPVASMAGLVYTDLTVSSGKTYFYVVCAVDNQNVESAYSNEAVAVIPIP